MSFFSDKGFYVDNRHFIIILASDVSSRDGLRWQLHEVVSNKLIFLLELFRREDLEKVEIFSYAPINVTFEVLENLITDFNTTGGRGFIDNQHNV